MEPISIRSPFSGAKAFFIQKTSSTQEEAKQLATAGYPPGSLVATDVQEAGRGRFPGRSWESERGKNLLFTIFLDPSAARLPGLPIRIGLALHAAVSGCATRHGQEFASPLKIKWPNDLMIGDRKVAGILCEAGEAGVFAGIGLNCNQTRFPPELSDKATSLALELGRELDRWELLELFLGRLADGLTAAVAGEAWRETAMSILWKRGEKVAFLPGLSGRSGPSEPLFGVLEGIDESGSLLIRVVGEKAARAYPAGELTVTPPAYRV